MNSAKQARFPLHKHSASEVLRFTLDTNCILAVAENRCEAAHVRRLAALHGSQAVSVALVAISASERQRPHVAITTFDQFVQRVTTLGLGHLEVIAPMGYWGISFWGHALCASAEMRELEHKIHNILFPNIEFDYEAFCSARGLGVSVPTLDNKWRNAKCDVQAFWSHAYQHRDIFVTSDQNFHAASKKPRLIALAGGRIETPESALSLIATPQSTGRRQT